MAITSGALRRLLATNDKGTTRIILEITHKLAQTSMMMCSNIYVCCMLALREECRKLSGLCKEGLYYTNNSSIIRWTRVAQQGEVRLGHPFLETATPADVLNTGHHHIVYNTSYVTSQPPLVLVVYVPSLADQNRGNTIPTIGATLARMLHEWTLIRMYTARLTLPWCVNCIAVPRTFNALVSAEYSRNGREKEAKYTWKLGWLYIIFGVYFNLAEQRS